MVWVWGIALFFGFWGYSYFRACLSVLTTATGPVFYKMNSPSGPLTLQANALQYDSARNFLHLENVDALRPDGSSIGRAASVSVQNVLPEGLFGRHAAVLVELSGISGTLKRLKDGELEIQKFLPKQRTETGKVAFSVRLVNGSRLPAVVRVVDDQGPTPWVGMARVSKFNLDGIGPRWVATGNVSIEGAGAAVAEVRNDPDQGISVDGTAAHLNLASLATHVLASVGSHEIELHEDRPIQILRSFAAQSLTVDGPVHVFLPKKGSVGFGASIVADARGFSYKDEFHADEAHFEGIFTNEGLKGVLRASGQGATIEYRGALSWGRTTVLGGSLNARITDAANAPRVLKRFLPEKASLRDASFNGWVAYSGGGAVAITGAGEALSASYSKEDLDNPKFEISASEKRVTLNLISASWNGSQVHGALNYVPQTKALEGLLTADDLSLGPLAQRAGLRGVSGSGQLQALVTGASQNPVFTVRASGHVHAAERGRRLDLGEMVAAADYANGKLNLDRVSVQGPQGVATAKGSWNEKTLALDVDIVGTGAPLSLVSSSLTGQAAFNGKVLGTTKAPMAKGRLEVYGATFERQQASLILADVSADRRYFRATNIQAFRDSSRASGQLVYDMDSHAIRGTGAADDIRLSDVFNKNVAGTVNVTNASLSGTLEHIVLHGEVEGSNIVAKSLKVDTVRGEIDLNGDQLRLLTLVAAFDQGAATASGTYDIHTRKGAVSGQLNGLGLADFATALSANSNLTGALTASFDGEFDNGKVTQGNMAGTIQNAGLNDFAIGSGPFSVADNGNLLTGSLSVSDSVHRLEIKNGSYNRQTKEAQGNLQASNLSLKSLVTAATPYIAAQSASAEQRSKALVVLPDQVDQQLYTLDGKLNASVSMTGKTDDPNLNMGKIALTNLQIGGRDSGTIEASGLRSNGIWNLQAFNWTGGPGTISASGTISEKGNLNLKGTADDLDPHWLALFEPSLDHLTGRSNLTFSASGPSKSPVIQSDLDYVDGAPEDKARREVKVAATVQAGQIAAKGTYLAGGISGPLSATLPFEYPMTIPKDRPISAELTFPERSIADLAGFMPWMDTKRSSGVVSGDLRLQGLSDQLKVTGNASLTADTLASRNFQTALTKVQAKADFSGSDLVLNASANGSNGGTVSISKATMGLSNLSDLLAGSVEALLTNNVSGQLNIDQFRVVQKGSDPMDAVIGGQLTVGNTLRSPRIHGNLDLISGSVSVPGAPTETTVDLHPPVDPVFAVNLSIPNPINVKAGVGQFQLTGDGTLGGSLALPNLDMQLVVDSGSVRLPNARIKIDPGGTVHLAYKSTAYGQPIENALVDLAGSTALTANPYGNIIQRYDVELQMRGDLLAANGLNISAQADPPDLSQDRILMMLGQGGLFLQQSANSEPYRPEQQLQQAAFTALPLLFDPFTQQLALGLGLDYFDVEYNPFEGVAVTGAKAFGKNLVLSARRQISAPLPGQLLDWDIRLSYRLPLKRKLRNLNLSVGANQQFPWRVALEYGWRF